MTTNTARADLSDPLYLRARQSVLFHRDASVATLQRKLHIGHLLPARLMQSMEGFFTQARRNLAEPPNTGNVNRQIVPTEQH